MSWEDDYMWQLTRRNKVEATIRYVAGDIINIEEANTHKDTKEATDYIVKVSSGDIACRIRREGYWPNPGDFTIRVDRPSGAQTELEKIRNGFARWYLYAWDDELSARYFEYWVFVDLDAVRGAGLLEREYPEFTNPDGTKFIAIPLSLLELKGAIIRQKDEAPVNSENERKSVNQDIMSYAEEKA